MYNAVTFKRFSILCALAILIGYAVLAHGQQAQKPQTVEQLQCGIVSDYLSAAQKSLELQRRQIVDLSNDNAAKDKVIADLKAQLKAADKP